MPTNQFLNLDVEKQNKIVEIAIAEFAQNGYTNASTNRIVKECDISKGSLFKYFENKEELYFHIIDTVANEMMRDMERGMGELSTELFQRLTEYSTLEISWYIKNPMKGRLLLGMAQESDAELCRKITERYGGKGEKIYYSLLAEIEDNNLKQSKEKIADILKWVLEGFNKDFLNKADTQEESFEQLKEQYFQKLNDYITILKEGFTKED